MQLNQVPKIKPSDLLAKKVEDDLLILDQENNKIHKLNELAAFIWNCCDGNLSVKDIVEKIQLHYDQDFATVKKDVSIILKEFQSSGLIELLENSGK